MNSDTSNDATKMQMKNQTRIEGVLYAKPRGPSPSNPSPKCKDAEMHKWTHPNK